MIEALSNMWFIIIVLITAGMQLLQIIIETLKEGEKIE